MRLSHVFVWRGVVRYWDSPPRATRAARATRRPNVTVPEAMHTELGRAAAARDISIQALIDLIFEDMP